MRKSPTELEFRNPEGVKGARQERWPGPRPTGPTKPVKEFR